MSTHFSFPCMSIGQMLLHKEYSDLKLPLPFHQSLTIFQLLSSRPTRLNEPPQYHFSLQIVQNFQNSTTYKILLCFDAIIFHQIIQLVIVFGFLALGFLNMIHCSLLLPYPYRMPHQVQRIWMLRCPLPQYQRASQLL